MRNALGSLEAELGHLTKQHYYHDVLRFIVTNYRDIQVGTVSCSGRFVYLSVDPVYLSVDLSISWCQYPATA